MGPPLHKITHNKPNQQVRPDRPAHHFKSHQVLDAYGSQYIIEKMHHDIRSCIVNDQGEQEEIKEHIEEVQPKVLSESGLIFTPWLGPLQHQKEQGYSY